MVKEYDVYKRRVTLLVYEEMLRKAEILVAQNGNKESLTKLLSRLLEEAITEHQIELTLEDEAIVADRVAENIKKRMEARKNAETN